MVRRGRPARRRTVRRTGTAEPMATTRTLADERKRLHEQQEEERRQRMAEYDAVMRLLETHGVKGLQGPAPRPGIRRSAGAGGGGTAPLRLLAEGDSWFDYPPFLSKGGVIKRVSKRIGLPILNLAKAGDEVRFMLGVEQREKITELLRDGVSSGKPWDVMLFSGGGNDIVDKPMALWIREYQAGKAPKALIHQPRFDQIMGVVKAGYEDLVAIRDRHSPATWLCFHGYDFAIPGLGGICGYGPWLSPTFKLHGYPEGQVRNAVVKEMLLQHAAMLAGLENAHRRVKYVQTQGTLAPQASSWHNELHPSTDGFDKIAGVFHAGLKSLFPGRVLG